MAASAAGLLIFAVFLTGNASRFQADLFSNALIGSATKEASRISGERVRTEISLLTSAISTADNKCTLAVTGDNAGSVSIVDFASMDFIVLLSEGMNSPQRLTYSTGDVPNSTGDWTKKLGSVMSPDLYEPGIFNPGETMVATGRLALPVAGDTAGVVVLGTPNGVTDSLPLSIVTPCP